MKQRRLLFYGISCGSIGPGRPASPHTDAGLPQAAALAVKKGTVQGTVGVVNTRNTVCVLESFAAFLSGHQIALFHRSFLLQSFCCGSRARNACYCITQEKSLLLLFYPKIHLVFLCGCGTKGLTRFIRAGHALLQGMLSSHGCGPDHRPAERCTADLQWKTSARLGY